MYTFILNLNFHRLHLVKGLRLPLERWKDTVWLSQALKHFKEQAR